jgi:hypothetical protein
VAAKKIEVFSAGCHVCTEAVELVKRVAGTSHNVEVLDMHHADVAARAEHLGVLRVPSVVICGKLANCCTEQGPDEATLRAAIHAKSRRPFCWVAVDSIATHYRRCPISGITVTGRAAPWDSSQATRHAVDRCTSITVVSSGKSESLNLRKDKGQPDMGRPL